MPTSAQSEAATVVGVASWNADLVSRVARPLRKGETLLAHRFEIQPGGKGSNAAVACARQGARVSLIARIGDDAFGSMATDLWRAEGIAADGVITAPGERSGVAQILVYDDGDNSIAVAPGAGNGLSAQHVAGAGSTIAAARVVMASCEVPLAATEAAFVLARAAGVFTLFNPAPVRPVPDALLALSDLINPNETEARALAGLAAEAPLELAAQALLRRGARAVLVTQGASGCTLWSGPGAQGVSVPGWPVGLVADTVGAGDTLTGALAAALARGESLLEAVWCANAAAALSVRGEGAIGGMPSLEQTRALLATHPVPFRPAAP